MTDSSEDIYRLTFSWSEGRMDSEQINPDASWVSTRHEPRIIMDADGVCRFEYVPITLHWPPAD